MTSTIQPAGTQSNIARAVLRLVVGVIFFAHGWQSDVPAARAQFGRWVLSMADRAYDTVLQTAGAFPREELLGQGGDDAPLRGIGVLRFVDQDVVGPTVQLEAHPLAHPRLLEQQARPAFVHVAAAIALEHRDAPRQATRAGQDRAR